MMPKTKRHGADTLWKVSTYEETEGKQLKRRRHRKKDWDKLFCIQTCSYIQTCLTHLWFYTQIIYRTNTFTHNRFYAQTLLHTNTHTDALTQTLLHRDSFTHKHFKRRRFYRQSLLHTSTWYTQTLYQNQPNSQKKNRSFWHPNIISCERVAAGPTKDAKNHQFLWHSHLTWCETVATEDVKLQ